VAGWLASRGGSAFLSKAPHLLLALFGLLALPLAACAQTSSGGNPLAGTTPGAVPLINVGGGPNDAQFFAMDFAQKLLEQQNHKNEKEEARRSALIASGTVSALDLAAPNKAVDEFNKASGLLNGRHSDEAIAHLQKAIATYPKFVSAHNYLGMAYQDTDKLDMARQEYETAASLDAKFSQSFVNLGRLSMLQGDYAAAESNLQKALATRPTDASVLTMLAYAQQENHENAAAIQTVNKIHSLDHQGMGHAHYVAAVAAVSLNDFLTAQREFDFFLQEDPENPLAATARYNLDILNRHQQEVATAATAQQNPAAPVQARADLANSEHLKAQLAGAGDETADDRCANCTADVLRAAADPGAASLPDTSYAGPNQWTIRKVVDEVAVFFGVTSAGHTVTGLTLRDITVRDDNQPPQKILQFAPGSKLPLRIGLLIDTSGSVKPRFSFEKHAAARFLQQMLSNPSDLGFVAGFSNTLKVTQDFIADHDRLTNGVDQLSNSGGTALFDAISNACWKLAAYPEQERVAKVLVVLSDGEENSSHSSLRQTIRDMEAAGVTVYTISTKESGGDKTDADKVMQMLADRSGGEAFFPGDMQTLSRSFDRLRDEIRSRYLIAYRPAGFEPNGKYRTISIVAEKDGKQLKVHARKGYHARADASTP